MYIVVPIVTDDRALADDAIAALQQSWPDWTPNDGDLEVVVLEQIAAYGADAAAAAAQVPDAVFETIVEQLHGIVRRTGTPAVSTATFTSADGSPSVLPEGTEIDVDGWAFTTDVDAIADPVAAAVPIFSVEATADANALVGDRVAMISAIAPIVTPVLDEPTGEGSDEETFEDYRSRATLELQLQATTLVTTRDYELMALTQTYVGRVLVVSDPATRTVKIYALQPNGTPLTTTMKNDLLALLSTYRETNWVVSILDPTISQIDVTYQVVMYPGNNAVAVVANVNAYLDAFLDPATWGQPSTYGEPITGKWLIENTVRLNKVIDVIGNAPGVNFVKTVALAGTNGTVQPNGDFLMTGAAPLANLRTPNGTATAS